MTQQDLVNQFFEKLAPFANLWQSAYAVSVACLKESRWQNLGTKLELRVNKRESDVGELKLHEEFKLVWKYVPMDQLRPFLVRMCEENIVDYGQDNQVFLCGQEQLTHPMHWWGPTKLSGISSQREAGLEEICWLIQAYGQQQRAILTIEELERVDSLIRIKAPFYANLETLLWIYTRGVKVNSNVQTSVDIVAPLPFQIRLNHKSGNKAQLCISAPIAAFRRSMQVVCYTFEKGTFRRRLDFKTSVELAEQQSGDIWRQFIDFDWAHWDREARVHLYYADQEVDSAAYGRWSFGNSLFTALDEFFDPASLFYRWLFEAPYAVRKGKHGKREFDSRLFEQAVCRLLVRIGIPSQWYGEGVYESRPDIGGVIEWTEPPTILIAECTLRDYLRKIPDFSTYRTMVREVVGPEFQTLCMLVTPLEVTPGDQKAAQEAGVALVGKRELWELYCCTGRKEVAVKYLMDLAKLQNEPLGFRTQSEDIPP